MMVKIFSDKGYEKSSLKEDEKILIFDVHSKNQDKYLKNLREALKYCKHRTNLTIIFNSCHPASKNKLQEELQEELPSNIRLICLGIENKKTYGLKGLHDFFDNKPFKEENFLSIFLQLCQQASIVVYDSELDKQASQIDNNDSELDKQASQIDGNKAIFDNKKLALMFHYYAGIYKEKDEEKSLQCLEVANLISQQNLSENIYTTLQQNKNDSQKIIECLKFTENINADVYFLKDIMEVCDDDEVFKKVLDASKALNGIKKDDVIRELLIEMLSKNTDPDRTQKRFNIIMNKANDHKAITSLLKKIFSEKQTQIDQLYSNWWWQSFACCCGASSCSQTSFASFKNQVDQFFSSLSQNFLPPLDPFACCLQPSARPRDPSNNQEAAENRL